MIGIVVIVLAMLFSLSEDFGFCIFGDGCAEGSSPPSNHSHSVLKAALGIEVMMNWIVVIEERRV